MEGLLIAFMAAVVGLLWSISSNVKEIKSQLKVEAYERQGLFQKPLKRWSGKGPEVTQPLPKVPERNSGRD